MTIEASAIEGTGAGDRQVSAFEDRYGLGSHARLLERLKHPCVTFAALANEFGVSRERVRQWQRLWLPEAPRGLERRRRCRSYRQRQRLFQEPLFRSFYEHARPQFKNGRLSFIRSKTGFRKHLVDIDGRRILLRAARRYDGYSRDVSAYALTSRNRSADFVFFTLEDGGYLFVPAEALPPAGTTFVDTPASKYQQFKNTFAALATAAQS